MRYRYRIEPTPAQQAMLARVFGCCRVVFNDALRVRDEAYRAGIKLSDSEIQRRVITHAKTTTERAWLCEVPSVALVQSVNDSRRAWRNFFDSATGKRKGRRLGRPRMKSRKDHRQSFRLTRNGFSVATQRAVVRGQGRRGPGALVARAADASRRRSRSSANPMATSTPVSSSTSQPHRCRRWTGRPGWMWGSRGWRRLPPATALEPMWRIRSIWVASCASWRGWSGRSPAGRKDQPTGTSRGARSRSRTARWPVLGGTITTSRLWRWFARTK